MASHPSSLRTVLIIVRCEIRRGLNRYLSTVLAGFRRKKKTDSKPVRTATPRKRYGTGFMMGLFALLMLVNGLSLSSKALRNLSETLDERIEVNKDLYDEIVARSEGRVRSANDGNDRDEVMKLMRSEAEIHRKLRGDEAEKAVSEWMETYDRKGAAGFRARSSGFIETALAGREALCDPATRGAMARCMGLLLVVLCGSTFLMGLAGTGVAGAEWHLEWLFTLPAAAGAIFMAKTLQQALLNGMALFMTLPLLFVAFFGSGLGWWAVPVSLFFTFCLNVTTGALVTLGETWLRVTVKRKYAGNIQAACTILGFVMLLAVFGLLKPEAARWFVRLCEGVPGWLPWLQPSCPIMAVLAGVNVWAAAAGMLAISIAIAGLSVTGAAWLVRNGLVVEAGQFAGSRGARPAPVGTSRLTGGIVGKELLLLMRNRTFLIQTLIMPVILIGFNLLITSFSLTAIFANPNHTAMLAFGIGAYTFLFSSFRVLAVEQGGLWLLYTFPRGLYRMLLGKALLWALVGLVYPAAVLGIMFAMSPGRAVEMVPYAVTALAGVFLYAFIAAGLGIATALAFDRSKWLAAPILTHAIYNASVIVAGAFL